MNHLRLLPFLSLCVVFAACKPTAPVETHSTSSAPSSVAMNTNEVSIVWQISTVTGKDNVPHSAVSLRVVGAYDSSVAMGTFDAADQGEVTVPGAVTARSFWYAGGGYKFAVFQDGQKLSIKKQVLEEESPTDLPWEEIAAITLPAGITVHSSIKATDVSSSSTTTSSLSPDEKPFVPIQL